LIPSLHTLQLRRIRGDEIASVHALLCCNGWVHRVGDVPAFTALIAASQVADVALLDGDIVGFVRGITDHRSNGYLSMVVVAPSQRRRGVGRRLVEHVLGSDSDITWVLRAGREGAAEFFASLGFEASTIAMERRRV